MRTQYDFAKGRKNPYVRKLKKQVTIRLDQNVISYFRKLSEKTDLPWQTLINLYLRECANEEKELQVRWTPRSAAS